MQEDGTRARGIIAVIVGLNFFFVIGVLIFAAPRPEVEKYMTLLIGALISAQATVLGFYFGSSSGAKVLVANQARVTEAAVNAVATSTPAPGGPLTDATPTGTPSDPVNVVEAPTGPPAPPAPPPAPPKPEPGFAEFRTSIKAAKPDATEAMILEAWRLVSARKSSSADDIDIPT